MSERADDTRRHEVVRSYIASDPEPGADKLFAWIERYPHYEHDLVEVTVQWELDKDMPPHITSDAAIDDDLHRRIRAAVDGRPGDLSAVGPDRETHPPPDNAASDADHLARTEPDAAIFDHIVAAFRRDYRLVVRTHVPLRAPDSSLDPIDILIAHPGRRAILAVECPVLAEAARIVVDPREPRGLVVERQRGRLRWLRRHKRIVLRSMDIDANDTGGWTIDAGVVLNRLSDFGNGSVLDGVIVVTGEGDTGVHFVPPDMFDLLFASLPGFVGRSRDNGA
jgi:hypothetical protein